MSGKDAPAIKWLREPVFDEDGVQASSGIAVDGKEYPDPVPMAAPIGLSVTQGDPLRAALKTMFEEERALFMRAFEAEGFEDEEEANDFAVEDDLYPADPNLPWDGPFDFTEAQEATEKAARAAKAAPPVDPPAAEPRASSEPPKAAVENK